MNPIRCPECGLINYRDDVTFPHCGQCQEDLLHCDSCRHLQAGQCTHTRGKARYTPDGDAAKLCSVFSSSHELRGSRLMTMLPAPLWVSLLLFLILASLAIASWFIDPMRLYFRGSPLQVETAVPQEVTPGQSFVVTMRVTNLLSRPSTPYFLEISADFLQTVDWESSMPPASHVNAYHQRLFLEYEPLPPGGYRTMQLSFTPRQGEIAPFTAKLYAPSNQLRHTISAPIVIAERARFSPNEGAFR